MLAERIYRQTNRLYDRARSPRAVDAARAQPTGDIDQLRGHRYCVLISYRRDGTPVLPAIRRELVGVVAGGHLGDVGSPAGWCRAGRAVQLDGVVLTRS